MSYSRISGSKIAEWLNDNYLLNGSPFLFTAFPPFTPEAPANLGIVTLLPGQGFENEKQFEVRGFSLSIRSIQNIPEIAEQVSLEVDTLFHTMDMPWRFNNVLVNSIEWFGGGPAPMPYNILTGRYIWVCSYRTISATGF